jgi:hypothetical protein
MVVNQYFNNILINSRKVHDKFLENESLLSANDYFQAKHFKGRRFENLKTHFYETFFKSNRGVKLVIGKNFALKNYSDIHNLLNVENVEYIDTEFFFEDNSDNDFSRKCEFLRDKILITTNHDICRSNSSSLINLQKFFLNCDNTVITGWDWDNHHNLQISSIYGLCSDIYFPSQRANEYELSRVTNLNYFIPPSAYEWSNDFLIENQNVIFESSRPIDIFGTFNFHPRFSYRNEIVTTLNRSIPEVRFISDFSEYTAKSQIEKLAEWSDAKWHWIVPTLNAVSVRAFYALIAGVGVILPVEFKSFEEFRFLDERDVVWYNACDVLDTTRVKKETSSKYLASGREGVIRRHKFAMQSNNCEHRIADMLKIILDNLK